jgi:hypothetical protein
VLSTSNWIDLTIFVLVALWYFKVAEYIPRPVGYPLFGGEEDQDREINLMRNVIHDIETEDFHLDYLLAAITALFWSRCFLLLKLSENFGPLIEMIYSMFLVFVSFIVLFLLELITFSCIAALSLTENPSFSNIL